MFEFDVRDEKKLRIIVDTDAACEADDPFAITQAMLTPKFMVRGITAEHFVREGSVERSLAEVNRILKALNITNVPAFLGEPGPMEEGREISPAVRFIIEEAMREDCHPLTILCLGAITNVAVAIRTCPEIISRIHVIWIGTFGSEPAPVPFREFNAGNDIKAANLVLSSGVKLWLVPATVYTTIHIGLAEIQSRIAPLGAIGRHLFDQMVAYNNSDEAAWTQGESWSLGDSPAVAIAMNPGCGHYFETVAPEILPDTSSARKAGNPVIREYKDVDSRFIIEDLIAKLQIHVNTIQ